MINLDSLRSKCRFGELSVVVEQRRIKLDVIGLSGDAVFDICTPEGSVLLTGRIADLREDVIDMAAFTKGVYYLYVIHEENIYREYIELCA